MAAKYLTDSDRYRKCPVFIGISGDNFGGRAVRYFARSKLGSSYLQKAVVRDVAVMFSFTRRCGLLKLHHFVHQ